MFRWADRAGSSQWELQLRDRESIIHSSQKIEKAASSVLLECIYERARRFPLADASSPCSIFVRSGANCDRARNGRWRWAHGGRNGWRAHGGDGRTGSADDGGSLDDGGSPNDGRSINDGGWPNDGESFL